MEYKYNIDGILKKNLDDIKVQKGKEVFICIYEILFKINSTKENPFLQYLMYKYQKSDGMGEIFSLPFFKYKGAPYSILKTSHDVS